MLPKEYRFFFKLLGLRVRDLRLSRGWTQERMEEFGFSLRHYQQIETGRPINLVTALRLSDAFEVDIAQLFRSLLSEARRIVADGDPEGVSFAPRPRGRPKRIIRRRRR